MQTRAEWSVVPPRCPLCDAILEATRSQRVVPAGGRWVEQGGEHWAVRCMNGHVSDGKTLSAAVEQLKRAR